MKVSCVNSYNNPNFDGYKLRKDRFPIYLNPIKYQVDKFFERSVRLSRSKMYQISPDLSPYLKEISIKTKDVDTYAYDIQNKKSKKYVLFLQGLGQNISAVQALYKEILAKTNFSVFAPEYRGFGNNPPATISNETFEEDSQAALDFLIKEKGIKKKDITLLGHSFGGYVASQLAQNNSGLSKMILVSSVDNLGNEIMRSSAVKHVSPFALKILKHVAFFRAYLKNLFSTKEQLEKTNIPVEIIHSMNDRVVSYKSAKYLAENSHNLIGIHLLKMGGHSMEPNKISEIISSLQK